MLAVKGSVTFESAPRGPGAESLQLSRDESQALMGRTHDKLLLGAARRGNIGRIRRLLDEGAEVNARGDFGYTPLVHASMSGHRDAIRIVLDAGADPSIRTDDGGTALYWVASAGHEDVVRLLLDRGSDANAL